MGSCAANTFATALNNNAAPTCTQPDFTNLAGSATKGQLPVGAANQVLGTNAGATAQEHKTLAVGTAGTDFAIVHTAGVITFNLPTASASNRGALSTADWTTFDNSVDSVTGTASQIASTGGQTPVLSVTNPFIFPGKATFAASVAGASSANIPAGTATSAPATGDFWYVTGGESPTFRTSAGNSRTYPPDIRAINTTAPLTGGGNLTTDRTLICTTCVTSADALTVNRLVLGSGSQGVQVLGSLGTTTTVLHGNAAGLPSFAQVNLTTTVTGILPGANGGTGNDFTEFTGPASTLKTFTLPNSSQTIETQNNKDAASGYAGLDGSTKLLIAQGQEVWAIADLSDIAGVTGTGTTAVLSVAPTFTGVVTMAAVNYVGNAAVEKLTGSNTDTTTTNLFWAQLTIDSAHTSGTRAEAVVADFQATHSGAGGTVTDLVGIILRTNVLSAGTATNNYALLIEDQAGVGTNNTAIAIAGTGVGNALTFGGDINLYRSAANLLASDDMFQALHTTTTLADEAAGYFSVTDTHSSGTKVGFEGVYAEALSTAAGNTTNVCALCTSADHSGSGTITNFWGLLVQATAHTGTVTNNYGIQVANQAGGTNNWAIKTGTGQVEFGDIVEGAQNLTFKSGTAFVGTLDHAITTAREWDFPDATGFVLLTSTESGVIPGDSTVGRVLRVTGANTYAFGALDLADGDAVVNVLPEANLPDMSTTAQGVAEAAIDTEVTTGTDAGRAVTPDSLAGSNRFGRKVVQVVAFDFTTALATGDGAFYFSVPAEIGGMDLVNVEAHVITVSSSGTVDVDLARCAVVATGNTCSGTVVDMLSTNLIIDVNESKSSTGAGATINTANDDVVEDQVIRVDVDGAGTGTQGLIVWMEFELP